MIIISSILFKALNLSIIFYFTPILLFISEIISPIIFSFTLKVHKEKIIYIILYIIGYFLEIISILIYNEIVIVNKFGLNENTTKYIKEREIEEKIDLINGIENEEKNNKDTDSFCEIGNYSFNLIDETSL